MTEEPVNACGWNRRLCLRYWRWSTQWRMEVSLNPIDVCSDLNATEV